MGPKLPRPLHRFPVGAALQQFWGGVAPAVSYALERRSAGSDAWAHTAEVFDAGGSDWCVLAIIDASEANGKGTILDIGTSVSGYAGAAIRLERLAGADRLQVRVAATATFVTRQVNIVGEWPDKGPCLVWLHVHPAAPAADAFFEFGVDGATNTYYNAAAGAGIPGIASDTPVAMYRRQADTQQNSAGALAFSIVSERPTDAQLNALGASPTVEGLRSLVADLVAGGATERLNAAHYSAGEITEIVDTSSHYTWEIVPGAEPLYQGGALPAYSLGVLSVLVIGQSNARQNSSSITPAMTHSGVTYQTSSAKGDTLVTNGDGVATYLASALDHHCTALHLAEHAAPGTGVQSWNTTGSNTEQPIAFAEGAKLAVAPMYAVWVQGESDSQSEHVALLYYDRLVIWRSEMIAEYPGIQLLIARLTDATGSALTHWYIVRAAQELLCATYADCHLLDTDDLEKHSDNIHYTEPAQSTAALAGIAARKIIELET